MVTSLTSSPLLEGYPTMRQSCRTVACAPSGPHCRTTKGGPMGVLRDRHGLVEVVTIDWPEARNAIDHATSKALADAFDDLEADASVRAVVLTGAGTKAFSAGMDL